MPESTASNAVSYTTPVGTILICRLAVPILERIASQATSWLRMSAEVQSTTERPPKVCPGSSEDSV
ncbi:hypothetical protein BQ8482_110002 [Mesorhizobium delmotii]|uniref:Uncharacterized protein n=2 Tax=Mesorhizobium delmotii TaxID=1631247 RepID=A0A2P9AAC4_9HYPH|nr:hypothetical protein BQ8482_110002 [Mesorhizobium delmotii]